MRYLTILAMVVLLLTAERGESQIYGSWMFEKSDDNGGILFAATANDSGALLGEWCFVEANSCVWLLAMKTRCVEGSKYPVLANSDAGAAQLEVVCNAKLDNGLYRYVFDDFEGVEQLVKEGLRVGFAVPLEEDQFRVVRFNLDGSNLVLNLLEKEVSDMAGSANDAAKPSVDSTRDIDI